MTKRHCKGAYVRIELPDEREELVSNFFELLREASEYAILRAHSIWKMSTKSSTGRTIYIEISDETFREDQERFREIAENNMGLFHLLMAMFFTKIHQEMKPRASVHKTRSRNSYLIAGMAQREFAHTCLFLKESDAAKIPDICTTAFGISGETWRTAFAGGRSVARVIHAFKYLGAETFFPIAYIDIQGRIDLLVRFPAKGLGLCIQIKTANSLKSVQYRFVPEVPFHQKEELTRDDQYFLIGITEFRNQNTGTWLPLEIQIGNMAYTEKYIDPPDSIKQGFEQMFQVLCFIHDPQSS